jgi:hypothetical protein
MVRIASLERGTPTDFPYGAGPVLFHYDSATGKWSSARGTDVWGGTDEDGSYDHAMWLFNDCYFTDAEYVSGAPSDSPGINFLLSAGAGGATRRCGLTLSD